MFSEACFQMVSSVSSGWCGGRRLSHPSSLGSVEELLTISPSSLSSSPLTFSRLGSPSSVSSLFNIFPRPYCILVPFLLPVNITRMSRVSSFKNPQRPPRLQVHFPSDIEANYHPVPTRLSSHVSTTIPIYGDTQNGGPVASNILGALPRLGLCLWWALHLKAFRLLSL